MLFNKWFQFLKKPLFLPSNFATLHALIYICWSSYGRFRRTDVKKILILKWEMFDIELASFTYSRAWHYSVIISCFPFLKIQIIVKDYYIIYHVTHPEFCVQCVCVQFCFIDQSDQGNEKKNQLLHHTCFKYERSCYWIVSTQIRTIFTELHKPASFISCMTIHYITRDRIRK